MYLIDEEEIQSQNTPPRRLYLIMVMVTATLDTRIRALSHHTRMKRSMKVADTLGEIDYSPVLG
jgi:hypothetical protein